MRFKRVRLLATSLFALGAVGGAVGVALVSASPAQAAENCTVGPDSITLCAENITATAGNPFSGIVGTYNNPTPGVVVTDADVLWGDSTAPDPVPLSDTASGSISGTHTYASAGSFTIKIKLYAFNLETSNNFTIFESSTATVTPPLAITTGSLPGGTVGQSYQATLASTGGTAPTTWGVTVGSLPTGLALDLATGEISGKPTADGTFTFSATATDSSPTPQTATKSFTIAISPVADLAVSISGPARTVQAGKPVTLTVMARNLGPSGASDVVVTDTLPSGSQYVSSTASQGSCAAPPVGSTGTAICSVGALASGGTATITLTVQPVIKKGTVSDTATVSSVTFDPAPANNSATATIQIK